MWSHWYGCLSPWLLWDSVFMYLTLYAMFILWENVIFFHIWFHFYIMYAHTCAHNANENTRSEWLIANNQLKQAKNYEKVRKGKFIYIAQYLILRTVQSAIHFTSLTDLFTQSLPQLLWEASSHMLQLMHEGCSYTCPPLSIARYSFI